MSEILDEEDIKEIQDQAEIMMTQAVIAAKSVLRKIAEDDEIHSLVAISTMKQYDALVHAGFTPDAALTLCKTGSAIPLNFGK